jgi:hypothetical protein
VQTKLDGRRAFSGVSGEGESTKRDEQALRGDRIGDDDTEKRSPEALWPHAESEGVAHEK